MYFVSIRENQGFKTVSFRAETWAQALKIARALGAQIVSRQ